MDRQHGNRTLDSSVTISMFNGIYPAIVSFLQADGSVLESSLRKLVRELADARIAGLYVLGGTGEGILLPVSTRIEILEIVSDEVSRIERETPLQIIAHIGAAESKNTIELIQHAHACGVDAVSSMPFVYYAYDRKDIVSYYEWLSKETELPLIIYASAQSGVVFTADMLQELSAFPTIQGIKFTGYNFYELMQMRNVTPKGFSILNGGDEVFLFGLLAGADGGIGAIYNVIPHVFCKLYNSFRAGNIEEAKKLQIKVNNLIRVMAQFPLITTLRYMLEKTGFNVGAPVIPNRPLSDHEKERLDKQLADLSYPEAYSCDKMER